MSSVRLTRRSFLKVAGPAIAGAGAGVGQAFGREAAFTRPWNKWTGRAEWERAPFTLTNVRLPGDTGDSWPVDTVVRNGCSFCPVACWHLVHVKNGQVVNVYGEPKNPVQADTENEEDGALCAKGRAGILQLLYNKYRITRPLKRVGPKPSLDFQPISWTQAYEEIARKLLELRDTEGPHVIAAKTTDRVSRDGGPPMFRLLHMLGSSNPTHEGYICNDAGWMAINWVFGGGGGQTNGWGWDPLTGSYDLGDTKFMMTFGSNDAELHPVMFGWMRRRKEATGATWVVVDPRYTSTAFQADLWLPVKPGTDMALVYGMIHYIVNNNLHDREFVNKWVAGFDELVKFVNGKGYSPEWAASITGIPAETIKNVARAYATTKPASVVTNAGINHHVNAVDCERVISFLVAITGNVGIPGGGHVSQHNSGVGLSLPAVEAKTEADKKWLKENAFKKPGIPPQPDYLPRAVLEGKPYPIKAVIYHGNPLTQNSDANRAEEAYRRLFTVYMGLFPEEIAHYADYVLPTTTFYEMDHVHRRMDRAVMFRHKVVDPIGEAKNEMLIYAELAQTMAKFDTKMSKEYWTENFPTWWGTDKRRLWNTVAAPNAGAWAGGITADRMEAMIDQPGGTGAFARKTVVLRAPCPPADHPVTRALRTGQRARDGGHPGTSVMYADADWWKGLFGGARFPDNKKRFGLDKIVIYHPKHDKELRKLGHSSIPEFYMSPENMDGNPTLRYLDKFVPMAWGWWNSPAGNVVHKVKIGVKPDRRLREKYPIQLTTGRPSVAHFHTITHWAWSLVQISGDRYCQMHPKLAKKLGVKTGDTIRVETPRDAIEAVALVWDGIQENTVFIPHTFGDKQKVHGDVGRKAWPTVNKLTAHYYDTLSGQNEYKCQLCRISKV
ncbi:MAG: molybdopterin-dependent oxidoreductase [Candidatus Methylomirabilales bacterium]